MSLRSMKRSGSRATSLAGCRAQPASPERLRAGGQATDPCQEASAPVRKLPHLPRPAALCGLALPVGATRRRHPSSPVSPASGQDEGVPGATGPNSLVASCGGSTPASCSSRDSQPRFVVTPSTSPVRGKLRPHHSRRAKTLYEPAMARSAQATPADPSEKPLTKRSGHCLRHHRCHSEVVSSARTPTSTAASSISASDSTCSRTPSEASHCSSTTDSIQDMCWRRGAKIGRGSYGCVYKALNTNTGQIFAIKEAVLAQGDENDHRFRDKLEKELHICQELRHPHIVSYLGHCYEAARLCIYLEYMPGGSLASLLNEFGPVVGAPFRTATRGLLEGLDYLHTRRPPVLHRDIKAANVLVDLKFCVKLADFGCSTHEAAAGTFTMLGSIPWIAPEVIRQQDGYDRKADVWSLGCTLIEMGTAEKPWGNDVFDNVMYALRHIGLSDATPPLPDELCAEGRELIGRCIRRNPEERPWAAELLQHPLLAGPP